MQRRAIQRAGERLEWGLGVYAGACNAACIACSLTG